jgi:peroxiredoxin
MTRTLLFAFTFFALNFSLTLQSQVPNKAEDISPLLIGEQIPDAQLLDVDGQAVQLKDIMKEKPTVLVFYRGGWCPYCNAQLSGLAEAESEIVGLGYQVVAISPDHFETLKPTVTDDKLNYNIYADPGAILIQEIGIGFKTPEKAKDYIFKKTNKDATDVLPVPAVFILDTTGKILFEYINPDYSTRLTSELLLANLKALENN